MEIESLSTFWSLYNSTLVKQRKSPENGDWKIFFIFAYNSKKKSRNKESLLKMEIESGPGPPFGGPPNRSKQRKSPENGDWKGTTKSGSLLCLETKKVSWKWRLKGNSGVSHVYPVLVETKKVSWKWRLKDSISSVNAFNPFSETKKVSWKWRLKVLISSSSALRALSSKQRKSPKNGDWKLESHGTHCESGISETKKVSWKWRLKGFCYIQPVFANLRNKESLLKMEIESSLHIKYKIFF